MSACKACIHAAALRFNSSWKQMLKPCCVSAGGYESFHGHYPELCTETKPAQDRSTSDTTEVQPGADYTQVKPRLIPLAHKKNKYTFI